MATTTLEAHQEEDLSPFFIAYFIYDVRNMMERRGFKIGKNIFWLAENELPCWEEGINAECFFCGEEITNFNGTAPDAVNIHSVDGDHDNWEKDNKVPVHHKCHLSYHGRNRSKESKAKQIRTLRETNRRDVKQGNFRRPQGRYWDSKKGKWIGKLQKSMI